MEKIEQMEKVLSTYSKLTIMEAQELLWEWAHENDEKKKKEIMDSVIFGSSHIVFRYIRKNRFLFKENGIFDMDDVINSFWEVWIERIQEGTFYKALDYGELFSDTFINDVIFRITGKDVRMGEKYGINSTLFADLFITYLDYLKCGETFTYADFLMVVDIKGKCVMPEEFFDELIQFFELMARRMNFNRDTNIYNLRRKISVFAKLLAFGKEEITTETIDRVTIDPEDVVIDKVMLENFMSSVDEVLETDLNIGLLHDRFGFTDGEVQTYESLGKKYNISRQNASLISKDLVRKLKLDKKIKKSEVI